MQGCQTRALLPSYGSFFRVLAVFRMFRTCFVWLHQERGRTVWFKPPMYWNEMNW